MALASEDLEKYGQVLLSLVPKDGTSKGNKSLIGQLRPALRKGFGYEMGDQDYWDIRKPLIEDGELAKGRGQGGSVYRVGTEVKKKGQRKKKESQLYKPFSDYVKNYWAGDNDVKEYIVEVTANQGGRRTGGKWTRPDITIVAVKTYTFTPGRHLEVVTFEVKAADQLDVGGVFETASHAVFAHKSYMVVECRMPEPRGEEFDRLEKLCKNFGVGLLTFTDVNDVETYKEVVEPERKAPDPKDVDEFIQRQVSQSNQNEIHTMLK